MLSWEQGGRWDLHSSGSFIFSCFEAHGKTPVPEELQKSCTSAVLPFPNPNPGITWGETRRLWSIVLWSLAFWETGSQRAFEASSAGRIESFTSWYSSVFPGTPPTPDATHSACRKVFAPSDQRKRVIFFQIGEWVQLLLCSQASTRAAATEERDPRSWEKGQEEEWACPFHSKQAAGPVQSYHATSLLVSLKRERMAQYIDDLKYHLEEHLFLGGESKHSTTTFLT